VAQCSSGYCLGYCPAALNVTICISQVPL